MKTDKNILIAFILNLLFSVFEMVGGTITGSVAIISDAVHDIGDAVSIGLSYLLERKSKMAPDHVYTYGYTRYSIIGSLIATLILLIGSIMVGINAVKRIFQPVEINYSGMIFFAVVGIAINTCAAWFTKDGDSLNQKAVNLHMMEDVFGWVVVLVGAVTMRITDISILDPILSIGVALFILIKSTKTLLESMGLFLEKVPHNIDINKIRSHLCKIDGVDDIHHIHIWSMDGYNHYATMHIVANSNHHELKETVKSELKAYGVGHTTLEFEFPWEHCCETHCPIPMQNRHMHAHHH